MTDLALAEAVGLDEDAVFDALDADPDDAVSVLLDGRLVLSWALLEDRVFTHRLGPDELTHSLLVLDTDLVVLLEVGEADRRLVSGEPLPLVLPGLEPEPDTRPIPAGVLVAHGALVLPPGALVAVGAAAGDLVGLRVTAGGIDLHRIDPADLSDSWPVRAALTRVLLPDQPSETGQALLSVLAAMPEAFRVPVAPVGEIAAAAGLTSWGDFLGPPGFDIIQHHLDRRRSLLAETYSLSELESIALLALVQRHDRLVEALDSDGRPVDLDADAAADDGVFEWLPMLAKPELAEALRRETLDYRLDDEDAAGLVALADLLEPQASRNVRPALGWLRAKGYEALRETARAEEALVAAERLNPDWPLTLLDLARYAGDRGDAARGLALLRRADPWHDVDLQQRLERYPSVRGPVVDRNDPCWCGSGRKFKQCHLHRPAEWPLAERAAWLYAKAGQYADDARWWPLTETVAEQRSAYAESDEAVEALVRDPLVMDAVLFEGGAFAEFLEVRGDLLPADERLLAEQWLLVDRSVFEVKAVRRGEGVTLRDVRTGDVHEVRERLGSGSLRPGHLICARVVPAGDTMQIFGGIEPVRLHERDALLALLDSGPDPDELVAFLTRRFASPTLVDRDGNPMHLEDGLPADEDVESSGPSTPLDPESVREALIAHMAAYERKWLDLPVPALHGLTPRQAAADPTRREDLVQLLASFPDTDDPTEMSAGRLREALGLTLDP